MRAAVAVPATLLEGGMPDMTSSVPACLPAKINVATLQCACFLSQETIMIHNGCGSQEIFKQSVRAQLKMSDPLGSRLQTELEGEGLQQCKCAAITHSSINTDSE